jgi:hypothetical protein
VGLIRAIGQSPALMPPFASFRRDSVMADVTVTAEDQRRMEQAIDEYSFGASLAPGSAQDIFCKNWPAMRKVLEFLKTILPQPGPVIIDIIIGIGDRLARKCPAPQA